MATRLRNAVGWQPTPAELAKLSPAARAQVQAQLRAAEDENTKAKEKRFVVSYYAPAVGHRVTHRDPIVAAGKAGAIAEVKAWLRGMSYVGFKGATNFMAVERKANPARGDVVPYFCADCPAELRGKSIRLHDGRHVCPRCARLAKLKSADKKQSRLFEDQTSLFQNGHARRNVEMGYVDQVGTFHPIRASKDYNEFKTTDVASPAERRSRQRAHEAKKSAQWYAGAEAEQGRRFRRKAISLAQYIRRSGGIAVKKGQMFAGEAAALRSGGRRRGVGTSGLISQYATAGGGKRRTPEYAMDAANAEGYRDAHGHKFSNIGDFLSAVADDASGLRKYYNLEDLNQYANPMASATKKNSRKGPHRCSRCGGAHHVAYCNARGSSPTVREGAKKNLFGIGTVKKAIKRRRQKKARVASARASIAAAKAQLAAAKANPRRQRAVGSRQAAGIKNMAWSTAYKDALPDSAFAFIAPGGHKDARGRTAPRSLRYFPIRDAKGKLDAAHVRNALSRLPQSSLTRAQEARAGKVIFAAARQLAIKNPDLLDVFAKGSAGLLNVLQIRSHLNRGSKRRNRKPIKRTAQRRMGNTAAKTKDKKQKANPDTRALKQIYETFHGVPNTGQVFEGVAPKGTPSDLAMLGHLRLIKLVNGHEQKFPRGFAQIGAAPPSAAAIRNGAHGIHNARFYFVLKHPLSVPARVNNGDAAKALNYGPIAQIEYEAYKDHLYGEGSPMFLFYHKLGEEGGRRPELILQNGAFLPIRGDYEIRSEGIKD